MTSSRYDTHCGLYFWALRSEDCGHKISTQTATHCAVQQAVRKLLDFLLSGRVASTKLFTLRYLLECELRNRSDIAVPSRFIGKPQRSLLFDCLTLKIAELRLFETMSAIYQATRRHRPSLYSKYLSLAPRYQALFVQDVSKQAHRTNLPHIEPQTGCIIKRRCQTTRYTVIATVCVTFCAGSAGSETERHFVNTAALLHGKGKDLNCPKYIESWK